MCRPPRTVATLLAAGLVLAACTGTSGAPTPDPPATPTPTATVTVGARTDARAPDSARAYRNPLRQPYPVNSIWNTPLSRSPTWVPAGIVPPELKTLALEEDILILAPHARTTTIYATTAAWSKTRTRCGARTDIVLKSGVPIPPRFRTDPGYTGLTPNHSAAILMPDGTLFETQPLHVCADGTVVSQFASRLWQGDSIYTGATPARPGAGSHGGSFMTALGGTIRLGEWSPGKKVIPHVLKIELWNKKYLSPTRGGHRWPALRADSGYRTEYGGSNPALKQGSLLGLRKTFRARALTTVPARILARTLKRYGAYVVDSTGRDAITFPVEWSNRGRVATQFEKQWGYALEGTTDRADPAQKPFLVDLETIYRHLAIVDDNGPTTVGGGNGPRMAPPALPLRPRRR